MQFVEVGNQRPRLVLLSGSCSSPLYWIARHFFGMIITIIRRPKGGYEEIRLKFKISNGYENIDRNVFFSLKKDRRTRGHEVKLVKDQCRSHQEVLVLTEDNK